MELEIETSDELRIVGRDADVAIRYLSIGAPRPRTRIRRLFSIDGIPVVAGVRPRPPKLQHDAAVLGYRLPIDSLAVDLACGAIAGFVYRLIAGRRRPPDPRGLPEGEGATAP